MSVTSLARLANARDATHPGMPVTSGSSDGGEPSAYRTVLVHAIPTEILAAYTALVGVITGALTTNEPRQYLHLRWALLVGFAVITPLTVLAASRLDRRQGRRAPWLEMLAATTAALAWFLAMPGSPLSVHVNGTDGAVASACITVAAGSLLSGLAPLLRRGSNNVLALPADSPATAVERRNPTPAARLDLTRHVPAQRVGSPEPPEATPHPRRARHTHRGAR